VEYRIINKRTRSYAIRVFMTLVVFLAITSLGVVHAAQVHSHKDQSESGCTFSVGKGRINFSAYQPQNSHKGLCSKFPAETGVTYFSLDLLGDQLQKQALKVKITPVKKGEDDSQSANSVMNFEVVSSPAGVLSFEHDFQGAKGHYRLDVINEVDNTQGSFNFEVGAKEFEWDSKFGQKVAFGLFGIFALCGLGFVAMRKMKA